MGNFSDLELKEIVIDDARGDHLQNAVGVLLIRGEIIDDVGGQFTERERRIEDLEILVKLVIVNVFTDELS